MIGWTREKFGFKMESILICNYVCVCVCLCLCVCVSYYKWNQPQKNDIIVIIFIIIIGSNMNEWMNAHGSVSNFFSISSKKNIDKKGIFSALDKYFICLTRLHCIELNCIYFWNKWKIKENLLVTSEPRKTMTMMMIIDDDYDDDNNFV